VFTFTLCAKDSNAWQALHRTDGVLKRVSVSRQSVHEVNSVKHDSLSMAKSLWGVGTALSGGRHSYMSMA
jgi:hypothetical protein